MELPAILTSTLQGIGGIATIVFANWIGEHILNRRLLSGIWVFVKKWWYKKTKEVLILSARDMARKERKQYVKK